MSFWRKKPVSAIDRRLQELAQELEQVRGEARGMAHQTPPAPPARAAPTAERPLAPTLADDDLFAHAARSGATAAGGPAAPRPGGSGKPAWLQSSREKFAHYFIAGHFQNLRPLRQESRVLRNKAIMMLILLLAALGWFYYIWRH